MSKETDKERKRERRKLILLVLALSVLASMAVYLLLYGLHGEEADAGTWLCCILSLISGVIVVRLVFLAQEQPKQQGDQCNEVNQCKDEQFSCKRLLWLLYTVPVACAGVSFLRGVPRTAVICAVVAGGIFLLTYAKFAHDSCVRWCAGRAAIVDFLQAEWALRWVRIVSYLTVVVFLHLPAIRPELRSTAEFTWCTLGIGVPLLLALTQTLFRVTFRRVASECIAAGTTLMYWAWIMANQQCPPELKPVVGILVEWTSDGAALGVLSGSVLLTAVYAIGKELISGVWRANRPGSESLDTWRNRLRKNRINVLQHRWYSEHNLLSSFNRSPVAIGVCLTILAVLGFLCIASRTGGSHADGIPFQLGLWRFCVTLMLLGCVLYFTSDNASLLQAEFYYICHAGPKFKPEEINQRKPRWLDFCQVFAHLYNSRVDVASEDKILHELREVVRKTADYQGGRGVCKTYFYAELLRSWDETRFKDEIQSGKDRIQSSESNLGNKGQREDYLEYPLAVHLARTLPAAFLQGEGSKALTSKSGYAHILALAKECYFRDNGVWTAWEKCRSLTSLNREDFQHLVILDIWLGELKRLPAGGSCPMAPMCNEMCSERVGDTNCPLTGTAREVPVWDCKAACAAFFLLFPLLAAEAMKKRYGDKLAESDDELFIDTAVYYYEYATKKKPRQCDQFILESEFVNLSKVINDVLQWMIGCDFNKNCQQKGRQLDVMLLEYIYRCKYFVCGNNNNQSERKTKEKFRYNIPDADETMTPGFGELEFKAKVYQNIQRVLDNEEAEYKDIEYEDIVQVVEYMFEELSGEEAR